MAKEKSCQRKSSALESDNSNGKEPIFTNWNIPLEHCYVGSVPFIANMLLLVLQSLCAAGRLVDAVSFFSLPIFICCDSPEVIYSVQCLHKVPFYDFIFASQFDLTGWGLFFHTISLCFSLLISGSVTILALCIFQSDENGIEY